MASPTRPVEESQAICEQVFADALDGHRLISNKSVWRNFPWVWNEHWSHRNMVLIGDALHSAHFSIGSGTRLAIEDAIALVKALEAETDIPAALARYESERKPIVKKLVTAARASADWYEKFAEHMKLGLMDFAYSYITRSGRIDDARLRAMSPHFMARYEASRKEASPWHMRSPTACPAICAGSREIGFKIPERYNASRVLFDNLAKGFGDRTALIGPAGTRSYGELCADACRWGNGFALARPEARRSRAAVPRRHAGLSGRVLRRGARRLRAAPDQHADAAGPAAILSRRFRRDGCGRRCRVLLALRRRGLQGHRARAR